MNKPPDACHYLSNKAWFFPPPVEPTEVPEALSPVLAFRFAARVIALDSELDQAALDARVASAVDEVVERQVAAGISIINDGEMSKPSYATYVKDRLDGFGGESIQNYFFGDLAEFPRSAELVAANPGRRKRTAPACNGPISVKDAESLGIVDNDWVEVFNANGAITCRAVVSQRVKQGMVMMYHAQERIVNVPGSETTGTRGGHHNSVTRAVMKPTHMIGGYAQQSYGFNYYGTVGCNRDEFVVVRKMSKVDWLDGPNGDELPQPLPQDV